MSELDKVKNYDDLSHKQWIAVATKLGGLHVLKAALREEIKIEIRVLKFLGKPDSFNFTNTRIQSFDSKPLADMDNVCVLPDFHEYIISVWDSKAEFNLTGKKFMFYDLEWPGEIPGNRQIRSELPEGHVFEDPNLFMQVLANLVRKYERQTYTELDRHPFLTIYSANVFYVKGLNEEVYCVCVKWHNQASRWQISAHQLDFEPWTYTDRIFSASV